MNWQDYVDYLKDKIIQERKTSESGETNGEETDYVWRWEGNQKYPTIETTELMENFEKIIESHENESYGSDSVSFENSHHQLPEMEKVINEAEEDEKTVLKTWSEMFPKREESFFGKAENKTPPSPEVWRILTKIYEDWKEMTEKPEKLKKQAAIWTEQVEKLLKEYFGQEAKKFLKQKGISILPELKQWLKDYETLSSKEQQSMKTFQEKITEVKEILEQKTSQEQTEKSSWYSDIPWGKVVKYGGGGFIILIGIGLIIKLFKE